MNFATKRAHEGVTSAVFRYGAAALLVVAAALITNPLAREIDTTPLFYAAVFFPGPLDEILVQAESAER